MKYIGITETASRLGLTVQAVSHLCRQQKIPGAYKDRGVWRIPETYRGKKLGRPECKFRTFLKESGYVYENGRWGNLGKRSPDAVWALACIGIPEAKELVKQAGCIGKIYNLPVFKEKDGIRFNGNYITWAKGMKINEL